jgi:hypothetical protein
LSACRLNSERCECGRPNFWKRPRDAISETSYSTPQSHFEFVLEIGALDFVFLSALSLQSMQQQCKRESQNDFVFLKIFSLKRILMIFFVLAIH